MYRLNHILVYPLIQLSAYPKDFSRELLKPVMKKYFSEQIEYLNDIFCGTGHGRKTFQKIINTFDKRTCGANDNSNNNNNNCYYNNTNKNQTVAIRWVLQIGSKTKKYIERFGFRVAFQTDPILKNILCKSKDKLILNSYAGVCELKYSCGSAYNDETKKKIISRSIEHQPESIKWNCTSSGAIGIPGNAKRNARFNSTCYTPKLSP